MLLPDPARSAEDLAHHGSRAPQGNGGGLSGRTHLARWSGLYWRNMGKFCLLYFTHPVPATDRPGTVQAVQRQTIKVSVLPLLSTTASFPCLTVVAPHRQYQAIHLNPIDPGVSRCGTKPMRWAPPPPYMHLSVVREHETGRGRLDWERDRGSWKLDWG